MLILIVVVQRAAGLKIGAQPVVAAIRAIVQLAFIAVVFQYAFQWEWTAFIFLIIMMTIASLTSASRISELPNGRRAAIVSVWAAAASVTFLIFALQMMEVTPSNLIAVGGIITGNAMSAATLTGRRFRDSSRQNRGEIEGWLALGATPQVAFARISRSSIEEMLLPTIDTTKNTGLVTLPGAFVGALIGGASPVEAARFQLIVLVGIMLAQTIVGVIATRILSSATVIISDEQPPVQESADTGEGEKDEIDYSAMSEAERARAEEEALREREKNSAQ